ncbi:hypothetical protein GCM10007392_18170 [Saccharospirillum salsuginis]|uniref:Uncharacterized protein n=1 Tax=Saccharospirillum salsuginis TaxID=418750 RepID=A0A918N8K4_9GAMM|nr:hypothetical protein GCM10007392_18170 [Saccharospirillum salsuginis]
MRSIRLILPLVFTGLITSGCSTVPGLSVLNKGSKKEVSTSEDPSPVANAAATTDGSATADAAATTTSAAPAPSDDPAPVFDPLLATLTQTPDLFSTHPDLSEENQRAREVYDPYAHYPEDLYQALRRGFQFDLSLENPRIMTQLRWYASHQSYFDRVSERAGRYMHHIIAELEARDMPWTWPCFPSWKAPSIRSPTRTAAPPACGNSFHRPDACSTSSRTGGTTAAAMSWTRPAPPWNTWIN